MIDFAKWWPRDGREGFHGAVEQKPYMVKLQVSRIQGNANLFDSEHAHSGFVALRILTASRERGLSNDWIHADKEIVEVCMSEAQWAALISSFGSGSGVPATLQHVFYERVEQPQEPERRTEKFKGEAIRSLEDTARLLREFKEQNRLTKKAEKEIEVLAAKVLSNVPFVASQFDEHIERRTEAAKTEIEAYMQRAIASAGIASLNHAQDDPKKVKP